MYKYCIIKGLYNNEENHKYISYGIVLFEIKNGKFVANRLLHDIFLDRQKAKDFIKLCNDNELSLIHLNDVLEDNL